MPAQFWAQYDTCSIRIYSNIMQCFSKHNSTVITHTECLFHNRYSYYSHKLLQERMMTSLFFCRNNNDVIMCSWLL